MVRLDRIYTRAGDAGETSLGDGERVSKSSARIWAYGTVDETGAAIGVAIATGLEPASADLLRRVQNDLFDLGADLCTPESPNPKYPPLRIVDAQVVRLEREIDAMNAELGALTSFILPGGSEASAWLHLARTVARRAERRMTQLAAKQTVNPEAIKYINRLSDHLFVLARRLNDDGATDVLWVPGGAR